MSKTIYVWNLPSTTTEIGLLGMFRRFGQIASVKIQQTAAVLTEATIVMTDDHAADDAVRASHGPRVGLRALDFGLERQLSHEVSWDGRSGGLNSRAGRPHRGRSGTESGSRR